MLVILTPVPNPDQTCVQCLLVPFCAGWGAVPGIRRFALQSVCYFGRMQMVL